MRNILNAELSQHTLKLQQLGAKVNVINSTLCYVNFDISGFIIQYVYNINQKGNYFLERTKPYPLALQEYGSEKDVVKVIREDIDKFKNALKCHHIDSFITIAREINATYRIFEETFLNYNIPGNKVEKIHKKIQALALEIEIINENAEKIFRDDQCKENEFK